MAGLRDLTAINPRAGLDREFYASLRSTQRERKDEFSIPPANAQAFVVKKGQVFRIQQQTGPQVGEVAFWNAHDPKEGFAPMRNRLFEGLFVTRDTRLWSDVPWLRPMMTCLDDTLATEGSESPFHHHRFWTHCSAESMEMLSGRAGSSSCHVNMLQAVQPFGLTEHNLRGNIVVFQKARFNTNDGRWYGAPSDAKAGDYVEFYAEIDILVAVSVCPNGNHTAAGVQTLNPLRIEIHATGVAPNPFPRWTDWRSGWTGKWEPPASTP